MTESVVVGIDGSVSALDATRVAAAEAVRLEASLRIVHAFSWPMLAVPLGPLLLDPAGNGLLQEAERLLQQAREAAEKTAPGLKVVTQLVTGAPVPVLLDQAATAKLVVLGDRGLGGFTGLLIGSVAVQLAAHSPVPVLVVKGNIDNDGPVVAGIDGSPGSASTLDWAARAAASRGAALHAVHTWTSPAPTGPGDFLPMVYDVADIQAEEEAVLQAALAGHDLAGLQVRPDTLQAPAAQTLIQLSEAAQLVVVGSRGRGGFAGLLLGSVSQHLLHHAHCPVLIVPHARHADGGAPLQQPA